MTTNNRSGFTLVELLVVISIIAMLAGLLLPAINAARENGRRVQCINNQRQIAYALLNFEHTKQSFPALRAPLKPTAYWNGSAGIVPGTTPARTTLTEAERTELTWVAFILPYMEQNTAWDRISSGSIGTGANNINATTLYQLVLPVMQCKSSGIAPGDSRISYVANAGPLNETDVKEYGKFDRTEKDAKMFTIFFDHFATIGTWGGVNAARCETKISVDNVSSMDGTSMTILVAENEDAGHWIWHGKTGTTAIPVASIADTTMGVAVYHVSDGDVDEFGGVDEVESLVGFCFPGRSYSAAGVATGDLLDTIANGEVPTYQPLGTANALSPLFINEGRASAGAAPGARTRTARPASGHPGVVVAAFCDQGTRVLRDDMDKTLFVRLSRPGSGVILNVKDLGL